MSAQDQTIDQYQELMQLNAVSHILRTAKQVGLLDALEEGQKDLNQLCEAISSRSTPTKLLCDALVKTGIIQQYDDDYALSPVARLLCQYDSDLGDGRWSRLADQIRGNDAIPFRARDHHDTIAATQWIHTAAAIQAAEILNIGGEGELRGPSILELGTGSAVWSCAMAFRDIGATIATVDDEAARLVATNTAESIDLTRRFEFIAGDPMTAAKDPSSATWAGEAYDIVLIPQRLHSQSEDEGNQLLRFAANLTKPGGRVVVIDLFHVPAKPSLSEAVEALRLEVETESGRVWSLEESQKRAQDAGLVEVQFSFLAASRINLGMLVGVKPLG